MLNYETLLSNYDDRLTLLEYLKKVEAALADASATSFSVTKTGNATLKFVLTFADGSTLESPEIVLQQGESVESAAISNNHLLLTLTNGDVLDAGDLFNGNVNINGNLDVTGKITGKVDPSEELNLTVPIPATIEGLATNPYYCKLIAKGGLLHIILCFDVVNDTASSVTLRTLFNAFMDAGSTFGAKIIDANGNNLAQSAAAGQSANIATIPVMYLPKSSGWTGEKGDLIPAMMFSGNIPSLPNRFTISIVSGNGITIPANTTYNFNGRITLAL